MNLFCQSVDFRNCPASAAEKLVLDSGRQKDFLQSCCGCAQISDALVLNTCNRLEFYFYAEENFDISEFIGNSLAVDYWNEYKQTFYGLDAVGHLFSVARFADRGA